MSLPGIKPLKNLLYGAVAHRTGLRLIAESEPADVFIVGFPKSGHTWFQYLTAVLLYGVDPARCPDSLVNDLVPDIDDRPLYRRHAEPMLFKSHELPERRYRRVIYLLRDGRDAMVSYFHHACALWGPQDFTAVVREPPRLPAKWHEHVEAWLANPYQAEMLMVRYEDLRRDTVGQLERICAFLGRTETRERLAAVTEATSFANLRAREQRLGWEASQWPKDKSFVRRGVVGSFRDEMPAEALALFLAEAEPTLRKLNYPL